MTISEIEIIGLSILFSAFICIWRVRISISGAAAIMAFGILLQGLTALQTSWLPELQTQYSKILDESVGAELHDWDVRRLFKSRKVP